MKYESHLEKLQESLNVIEESIEKGIVERQRTIGFSTSAACVDMLEMLLHKHSVIDPGFTIKHEWLKSNKKIKEKFPFEFPKKKEILNIVMKIEEQRDPLCYGRPQKQEIIQEVVSNFNKIKEIFREAGLDEF